MKRCAILITVMVALHCVARSAAQAQAKTQAQAQTQSQTQPRSRSSVPTRPPNVVFILTDNQGAWTLGCYGNPEIRTPHIDRLAAQGMRMTRALSSNPVCSPTRATFLTGLIPSQHGVHSFLDNRYMMGPEAYNTLQEFQSLGEILKDAGYRCGLSGKWHLGNNLVPSEGFDFWITKTHGSSREMYDDDIIENSAVRKEPGYTTDLWTQRGIEFIEQNQAAPFFLMLAYNGPYNLGAMMSNRPRNRWAPIYKDMPFTSFPRDTMHPWQHVNKAFHNSQVAMERCAAETSGIDDGVGEVMATLQRLGLEDDTLVIYAADQGWMGGQNGMWGMGDHFRPIGAHELMMHIPWIFRHPGQIQANQTCDLLVSNYDFLPTVLGHLGMSDKLPGRSPLPGKDFSPALRGQSVPWENVVYYEMEGTRAVRTDDWKYVARYPAGPFELYDKRKDPQERFNLYGQPDMGDVQQDLAARLDQFFARYADPQYDLWNGGRSKASRLKQPKPQPR
ncbi:MAG: sulfatase [Planctomycetaceae bacterium]